MTTNIQKPARALLLALGLTTLGVVSLLTVSCTQASSGVAKTDSDFILAASQGGMTEVKLGQLASQKGLSADVKAFGDTMVSDHTSLNSDLATLATLKGVTLPGTLDAAHQKKVDQMSALSGAEFDSAYIMNMIDDHSTDARDFKTEAASTLDTDVKVFVAKASPIMEAHALRIAAMKK